MSASRLVITPLWLSGSCRSFLYSSFVYYCYLFSYQCKEIEENNRMGKTRDLKKIRYTKGTFHAKMGSIKDRNGMALTEAEDIKKR